ncbi:MAG TPA: 4-(cytidine 5'-diphospho)-2-C-methyl-D-erythritol kinase [Terriglobales bacterium]|jgi:4-diphosphocytidyl-2-C-methyl-D-erythritol kinase|nr:4-(cytidine 5'-diphospho)-2-C-methyl-D-erythritol kinase [Terriglobales bacterium]
MNRAIGSGKAGDTAGPDVANAAGARYAAPAKLNLFLHVVGRRADGYHWLQTAFRFIDYGDELGFSVRNDGLVRRITELAGVPPEADLCVRAARLLKDRAGSRLGVDIELVKRLPMGGGLGGGSSDAATTLIVLNRLWQTGLSRVQLQELALELGADVPVFVFGRSAFAEGVGERLAALQLPPAWYLVLVPETAVSTAEIFSAPELTRNTNAITIAAFSVGQGRNDLEPVVCRRYPQVARHLEWLRQYGDARMTGSGACVFCGFETEAQAQRVLSELPADVRGFVARGLDRHPLWSGGN